MEADLRTTARLVHDYGRIEHDRVWEVATVHVPALAAQLDAVLPTDQ